MIDSFNALRTALISQPVLGMPKFSDDYLFILDTDYSKYQIAGILSQRKKSDPAKLETVLAYGSKKLNPTQQKYPASKGITCFKNTCA